MLNTAKSNRQTKLKGKRTFVTKMNELIITPKEPKEVGVGNLDEAETTLKTIKNNKLFDEQLLECAKNNFQKGKEQRNKEIRKELLHWIDNCTSQQGKYFMSLGIDMLKEKIKELTKGEGDK